MGLPFKVSAVYCLAVPLSMSLSVQEYVWNVYPGGSNKMLITPLITTPALKPLFQFKMVRVGMRTGVIIVWPLDSLPKIPHFSCSHSSSRHDPSKLFYAVSYLLDCFVRQHPAIIHLHIFWVSYLKCQTNYSNIAYYWFHFQWTSLRTSFWPQ